MELMQMITILLVLLLLIVVYLLFRQYKQKRDMEAELLRQSKLSSDLELKVHQMAEDKFEQFKVTVLQVEQQRIAAEQSLIAEANFERWKMEYEGIIRQDAIKKARPLPSEK